MFPGDTRDTETPVPANWRRKASEKPRRPYFVAEYNGSMATRPANEPTVTIAPWRRPNIPGITSRVSWMAPSKFAPTKRVRSSCEVTARGLDQLAPAALTSTSTFPKASTAR